MAHRFSPLCTVCTERAARAATETRRARARSGARGARRRARRRFASCEGRARGARQKPARRFDKHQGNRRIARGRPTPSSGEDRAGSSGGAPAERATRRERPRDRSGWRACPPTSSVLGPRGGVRGWAALGREVGHDLQCCQRGKPVKPSLSTRPFHPGRREAGSWPDSVPARRRIRRVRSCSRRRFSRSGVRVPHSSSRARHAQMSGILRAAAPLARRLNAVPKGPVTQATRGFAGASRVARFPRRPRGAARIFSLRGRSGRRAARVPRLARARLASAPSRAAPSPAPPSRRRSRAPPRAPRLNPPPRSFLFAADPNAPPKVAYPWLDPGNPQNWKEEHVRLPAVPNPRFPPPNPAPDARGDRDAGRTPETARASSDRRAWVGPPADADAACPRVGRRPPNDGSNAESDALAHRSRSSPLSPRDTPRSCSPSSAGGRSSSTAPRRPSRSD